jgi:hypothetical protein
MTYPEVIERLARHLRLNFVPGTTAVPWAEASDEERDVWCIEATHFLEVAVGTPVPVSPHHPTAMEFVEDEEPVVLAEGALPPTSTEFTPEMELPSKWSQPRSV